MKDSQPPPEGTGRITVLSLLLAPLVPLVIAAQLWFQAPHLIRDAHENLDIVTRLKVLAIESWLTERRGDARVFASDTELSTRIAKLSQNPSPQELKLLADRLDLMRRTYAYPAAFILDTQGNVLLAAGEEHTVSAQTLAQLPTAFASGEVRQSDFFIAPQHGRHSLDFTAPIYRTANGERKPVAALVLQTEPASSIFPVVLTWPFTSVSGEVLLVRAKEGAAIYISELRHTNNTELKLSFPLDSPNLPAAIALRTYQPGVLRGTDYRGVDVLAAYRPVAGTDWRLIAKLDHAEVIRPLWAMAFMTGFVTLIAIVIIGLLLRKFWNQQFYLRQLAMQAQETQALQESEAHLRAAVAENQVILSNALVGIVHLKQRYIVSCNRRFEEIFQYAPGELIGKTTECLYDSIQSFMEIGARVYPILGEGKHYSCELQLRHKDGSLFWGALTGRAIDPAQPNDGSIWIYADISERFRSEQESSKLRLAVEQSGAAIVITDPKGIIEYANPAFFRQTGYTREDAIGQSPRIMKSGHTPPAVYADMWKTILGGGVWHGVLCNRKKSGDLIWEDTTISPVLDTAGKTTHFVAVKEDVTERKHIEDELAEHRSHLGELVQQRTTELREALDAAQVADRAKDAFLANISHELRTPLSAVIGFSGLARPFCTDARQRDYLDKVSDAGKTLSCIIDDLLDLSKIAAGRMELEARPFHVRQLVARSCSVISFKAEEKGLTLNEDIAPDVPAVLIGDTLRLEQILLNLLSNAVKFTAAGHIDLHLHLHARETRRVCLEIEVTDSGIGLSEDDIARLFQPFSQADAAHSRTFGGTGLGLAICKRLAELMQGEITVSSSPGAGASFRVRVWLDEGDAATLPENTTDNPSGQQVRYLDARVLVVDDQPFNRDIVEGLLAAVGIVPRKATNGQEALDLLSIDQETFDLVLMDIRMPVMDGLTATREIRRLPGREQLPIIAMTAHTMTHERENCFAAGMNDHIGKPFDEAGFYRVLAKWIPQAKQLLTETPAPPLEILESGLPPLTGVDIKSGLALLQGDVARYRHWLGAFVAEAPATLAQLREHLTAGDTDQASMAAHTLKGRSGLLGMKQLHTLATQLERAIESKSETAAPLLLQLDAGVAQICTEIQSKL